MIDEELRTALRETQRIVFACSGNMVRSAFAELYARHLEIPRSISSVATTYRNGRIFPETAQALKRLGVSAQAVQGFRPTHIDDAPHLFDGSCILFAMTRSHLHALAGGPADRVPSFLFPRILARKDEIADPVLEGADFGLTFRTLERCTLALLDALREEA